jgi:hypothetical protein
VSSIPANSVYRSFSRAIKINQVTAEALTLLSSEDRLEDLSHLTLEQLITFVRLASHLRRKLHAQRPAHPEEVAPESDLLPPQCDTISRAVNELDSFSGQKEPGYTPRYYLDQWSGPRNLSGGPT